MKKVWRMLLLAGVFTVLLCVSAMAAGTERETLGPGFYMGKSTGMTIKPVTTAETKTIVVGGTDYSYYQGSEKMEVSSSANAGNQYLVMLVTGTFEDVPTKDNKIIYVNQKAATGSTVTFGEASKDVVYPNLAELGQDEPLTLLITSNDGTAMKKTTLYYSTGGSYDVKQYKLGDASGDDVVNVNDAVKILKCIVGNDTFTGNQQAAADANGDGVVNVNDAVTILKYIVGNGTLGKQ